MSMFWDRNKKWFFVATLLLFVIAILGGVYLYSINNALLDRGESQAILLSGKPVITLGAERKTTFSGTVDEAFQKSDVPAGDGRSVRIPKYPHNALFSREADRMVYATDIDTNELSAYKWTENTGYVCLTVDQYALPQELNIEPDLKRDLKNYVFLWIGESWRGTMGEEGLNLFRYDVNVGDGLKLYTTNDESAPTEVRELVEVVLFGSYNECTGIIPNLEVAK